MNEDKTNTEVDPFEKNIDIAIEAQDGPTETPTADVTEGTTEKVEPTTEVKPDDSKVDTGDVSPKPPVDKEVSEAAKKLAGAKDLTLKDGTTIKGGAERRFYEQRETARQERDHERQEHQRTREQVKNLTTQLESTTNSIKSIHGADPSVLAIGAKIVGDLQRDPVGTTKKLLAEAIAQGYDLSDMVAGIDMAEVRRLIDERSPQQQQGQTEEQIREEATQEVSSFFGSFPDARPHETLIARVLQDHPSLSLRDVYFQLKNDFAEKGFDWSRSLEDNLKDMSNTNDAGQSQTNTNNPDPKPLPNGRGNEEEFHLNKDGVASDDMDTGDIVRQAMRESGLKI